MLADGVEASVRSLASRDEPAIRAMVTRIIEERIADGQFDECDLTLRDLRAHPDGVRRAAARHVPHADRLSAEHDRRAGVAAGRGRRRGRSGHAGLVGCPGRSRCTPRRYRRHARSPVVTGDATSGV